MGETTTTLAVGGMTCAGCAGNVQQALEGVAGVVSAAVDHKAGSASVAHAGVAQADLEAAVAAVGYSVGGGGAGALHQLGAAPAAAAATAAGFHWHDGATWRQSAHNTKWCLIGCSIGDFGTIAAFQFFWPDSGWDPLLIMALAMLNGLLTSIALETVILIPQLGSFAAAFNVAIGMSLISMLGMEAAMNITDLLLTGGAMLTWWVIPPMLIVGFLTPWPYNYWRLKKYGAACH